MCAAITAHYGSKKVFFELDCHFYEEFLLPQLKLLTHILNLKFVPKRLA